jgi:hypothetical protein
MTEPKLNLREKLNAVYTEIEFLEKTERNERQKYDFLPAAEVMRAIRKAFIKYRVYAETNFEYITSYDIKTNSGGAMHTATVRAYGVFFDLDSDETKTFSGLGDGADMGDKGIYKSQTGSLKNALKNAFLIPDSADPEADQSVDDAVAEPAEEPQPLPRRARRIVNQEPAEDTDSRPAIEIHDRARTTRVPAAEIPTEFVPPSEEPVSEAPESERPTAGSSDSPIMLAIPKSDGKIASDKELAEFGIRIRSLGDDLGSKGGLKASRGMPVNRKVLAYLLRVTESNDATKISMAQWQAFFQFTDKMAALDDGYTKLANLINGGTNVVSK